MKSREVLSGQAGLAGLLWMLNGRPTHRLLRSNLSKMLAQGCVIGRVQITRAKYKPGRKLSAYYNFHVLNPDSGLTKSLPLAITWKPDSQKPDESRLFHAQQDALAHNLVFPFNRLWNNLPEQGIQLQVWPLDPDFPQLARIGDPQYSPHLFRGANLETALCWEEPVKVTPVRYRPGERHVLIYSQTSGQTLDKSKTYFAKIYQEPEESARAFRIASRVVNWLDGNVRGFMGARPAGWNREDAVILYPFVPGVPLSRQLRRSPGWLAGQLRLVGTALAALHGGPRELSEELEETSFEKQVKATRRACEHIQDLLPETWQVVEQTLDRALELNTHLPGEPLVFTHADFKADHLLTGPSGITLIDFDTCALADPALDIGKFLADLDWWFLNTRISGVEQAQDAFLNGYFQTIDTDRLHRAWLYHTVILIKIAARRARLYRKNWGAITSYAVQKAAKILDRT